LSCCWSPEPWSPSAHQARPRETRLPRLLGRLRQEVRRQKRPKRAEGHPWRLSYPRSGYLPTAPFPFQSIS